MVRFSLPSLAVMLLAITLPVNAQQPSNKPQMKLPGADQSGKIEFPNSLIPKIPSSLPLLKLTAQAPPTAFLTDTLSKIGIQKTAIQTLSKTPALAERGISPQLTGVVEEDRVLAYWHPETGEAEISPQLEELKTEKYIPANNPHLEVATSLARTVFERTDILPKDSTQYTLGAAIPMLGSTAQKANDGGITHSEPAIYLTYVPVHRSVQDYPVYGPGSRALIGVDNAGTIQAFVLHWKAASANGAAKETRTPAQVYSALHAVVEPLTRIGDVHVQSVGIGYYDDDESAQMGPAYRLTVRVHSNPSTGATAGKLADDDLIVLYAQYGNAALPPSANPSGGAQPETANENRRGSLEVDSNIAAGDPTVGRYVVRNDNAGWVNDANSFWNGLTSSGGGSLFTNSQYYWAEPWEFTTYASQFVDSVQVGEVEAHGDWWYFTTYQDWGDGVNLDTNPAPGGGYGQVNHGKLNYLILHGCEIVPSAAEAPCPKGMPTTDNRGWPDPWFRLFQGLHVAVGYRTIMYINDNVGQAFGTGLRNSQPVISAWANALLTAGDYQSKPRVIAHCGANPAAGLEPGDNCPSNNTPGCLVMGEPSAVTVCGHSNDNIFDQSSIPAASCLTNYWWWNN
ncbi:MAG: DUF6345 domain-containing protein [Terracidiphilus sp.]|jgi:hypothetical protein